MRGSMVMVVCLVSSAASADTFVFPAGGGHYIKPKDGVSCADPEMKRGLEEFANNGFMVEVAANRSLETVITVQKAGVDTEIRRQAKFVTGTTGFWETPRKSGDGQNIFVVEVMPDVSANNSCGNHMCSTGKVNRPLFQSYVKLSYGRTMGRDASDMEHCTISWESYAGEKL